MTCGAKAKLGPEDFDWRAWKWPINIALDETTIAIGSDRVLLPWGLCERL